MNNSIRRTLAAALTVAMTGCATVTHGPMQRIYVNSEPQATVRTHDCGVGSTKRMQTPGVVWVSRRADRCAFTFEAPGYQTETRYLSRMVNEKVVDNVELADDLCGGIECNSLSDYLGVAMVGLIFIGAGVGIDAATGALFRQEPSDVIVRLKEQ